MASNLIKATTQNSKLYQLKIDGTGTAVLLGRDANKFTLTDNGTGNYTLTPVNTLSEPPVAFGITTSDDVIIDYSAAPASTSIIFECRSLPVAQATAVLSLNGIKFHSLLQGADGNDITIQITGGATAGSEVVTSTSAGAITIQVETTVSTATQVYAALKAKTDATLSAFVAYELITGATTWATADAAPLAGGVNAAVAAAVDADFDVLVLCSEVSEVN